MSTMKYLRGAFLAILSVIAVSSMAQAQVPGGGVNPNTGMSANASSDKGYVMLAELTPQGVEPRAARPSTIGADTPLLTHAQYLARYPASGEAGYQRLRASNQTICDEAQSISDEVAALRVAFGTSDEDYAQLMEIYSALPKSMKRHSAVTAIASIVTGGALCALSAGSYCIAAIASAGGNLTQIHGNLKMQLANIKLSQANITLTRINIRSNLLTLRADDLWVRLAMPACKVIVR